MVPTPTFAAKASIKAISESDKPGSCWRVSAQNHCARTPRAMRPAARVRAYRNTGKSKAAPNRSAANNPNPAQSPAPHSPRPKASAKSANPAAACQRKPRAASRAQARGWAVANKGRCHSRHRLCPAAASVPAIEMPRPASHQDGRKASVPATSAP